MLDPLQEKFGDIMTGLLFVGALCADLLWAASLLGALGKSGIHIHQAISLYLK